MDGIDTSFSGLQPVSTPTAQSRIATVESATPARATTSADVANLISLLADAAPPIDSKKVEAIRSLIAQGRYPIDERAIASKMIAMDVVTAH